MRCREIFAGLGEFQCTFVSINTSGSVLHTFIQKNRGRTEMFQWDIGKWKLETEHRVWMRDRGRREAFQPDWEGCAESCSDCLGTPGKPKRGEVLSLASIWRGSTPLFNFFFATPRAFNQQEHSKTGLNPLRHPVPRTHLHDAKNVKIPASKFWKVCSGSSMVVVHRGR